MMKRLTLTVLVLVILAGATTYRRYINYPVNKVYIHKSAYDSIPDTDSISATTWQDMVAYVGAHAGLTDTA